MTILDTIVEAKRREVVGLKRPAMRGPESRLRLVRRARFPEALRGKRRAGARPSLIAEIKKASPSEGMIRADFDPVALARAYEAAGAAAISVLTDGEFFKGSLEDLRRVAQATSLPVLCKDFMVDEVQIHEAAEAGAAAILLIAAILSPEELRTFREVAESLGLEALVEIHDARELAVALDSGAMLIGINNRDLATFSVDLETTLALVDRIPDNVTVVSESGINDRRDMAKLHGKVDGVLIGTSILRCPDVGLKIRELLVGRPLLKVCGIRDMETAGFCEELGVDLLGFNFVDGSPRAVTPDVFRGHTFRAKTVGLFRNVPLETVRGVVDDLNLDLVQLHGEEGPEQCVALGRALGRPVIKSFLPGQTPFDGVIPLFDLSKDKGGHIGVISASSLKAMRSPFGLAGGLTPDNVRAAVGESCPLFVDVARGVETYGRLDFDKIHSFFNQIQPC